jgi:hypothetical protein
VDATINERLSEVELSHFKMEQGYSIVAHEPKFPQIRSIWLFSSTKARFVFKLNVFNDRFSTDV